MLPVQILIAFSVSKIRNHEECYNFPIKYFRRIINEKI